MDITLFKKSAIVSEGFDSILFVPCSGDWTLTIYENKKNSAYNVYTVWISTTWTKGEIWLEGKSDLKYR